MMDVKLVKQQIIFTKEELEKFRITPLVNPKTGRKISENGKIYKILNEQLQKLDHSSKENINIIPKIIIKKLKDKPLK
jgi:hypothetical protein